MKPDDYTLRSKPHIDGGKLYWWNNQHGFNAFGVPFPALFRSEEEATAFLQAKTEQAEA